MKVRDLLTDESKWCQGGYSKDACGDSHWNWNRPMAVSWCLSGAIRKCYDKNWEDVFDRVREKLGSRWVSPWNDDPERTFGDVRSLVEELDI
jgi:hypothetical protein